MARVAAEIEDRHGRALANRCDVTQRQEGREREDGPAAVVG
jgi:hypothetical protein